MNYKLSLSKIFVCARYTEAGSLYIPGKLCPQPYICTHEHNIYIYELL